MYSVGKIAVSERICPNADDPWLAEELREGREHWEITASIGMTEIFIVPNTF